MKNGKQTDKKKGTLHPWLVDLRHLSEIVDFTAIDHNFIRVHGFIWSEVHVETDSDNILAIGLKPENERNATPNPGITFSPVDYLTRSLHKWSNCNYSRFCFFHGLKVHTGDLDRDWRNFESANLKWLNKVNDLRHHRVRWFYYGYYWWLFIAVIRRLFRHAVVERRLLETLRYFFSVLRKLSDMILGPIFRILTTFYRRSNASLPPIAPESCAVCRSDARRCVSGDMALTRLGASPARSTSALRG